MIKKGHSTHLLSGTAARARDRRVFVVRTLHTYTRYRSRCNCNNALLSRVAFSTARRTIDVLRFWCLYCQFRRWIHSINAEPKNVFVRRGTPTSSGIAIRTHRNKNTDMKRLRVNHIAYRVRRNTFANVRRGCSNVYTSGTLITEYVRKIGRK